MDLLRTVMHLGVVSLLGLLLFASELRAECSEPNGQYDEEEEVRVFMECLDREDSEWLNRKLNAAWDYETNITDYNLQKKLQVQEAYEEVHKKHWEALMKYPRKTYYDPSLSRELRLYSTSGPAALPQEKMVRYNELTTKMKTIYSETKLVDWQSSESTSDSSNQPTITLDPDLIEFFAENATDSCGLTYYWDSWFSSVGRQEKPLFEEFVTLGNEEARLNNFTDKAAAWNDAYEIKDFEKQIHKLYLQILPLYQQLHAYVRRRLAEHHNSGSQKLIYETGSIPAHILGNVWAQEWEEIYNLTAPYPGKASPDPTPAMIAKHYTPLGIFKVAQEIYKSIGLKGMTETFWKKSIFEKPTDRDMMCHSSAWDLRDGEDYRIKMCTEINFKYLQQALVMMGHIEYYMAYKNQPEVFRAGANPGFTDAVGNTIVLSISTPEHLLNVGLLDKNVYELDKESEINSLFFMALEKIAFLPFAYVLDLWRWELFKGNVKPSDYNCRFWQMRQDLQGIVPPVDRSADDLDAAGQYQVAEDKPYIKFFVSTILQFQFHKAVCTAAGEYDPQDPASKPLRRCDIFLKKEAGPVLENAMRLGRSMPPQEVLEAITGAREMDAGPLLEYFKPLHDWLIEENSRTGEQIGWHSGSKIQCVDGQVKTPLQAGSIDKSCHYFEKGTNNEISSGDDLAVCGFCLIFSCILLHLNLIFHL